MKPSKESQRTLKSLVIEYQTSKCNSCLGEIYTRNFPKLLAYCKKLTQNKEDAYDITMDSFIKASEKIHMLRDADYFMTWLFRIAHNLCMDRCRRIKKQQTYRLDDSFDLVEDTSEVEYQLQKEASLQEMNVLLENIEPKNKQILVEKYINNKSIAEIKTQMGITESAIKMRLLRARKKMLCLAS